MLEIIDSEKFISVLMRIIKIMVKK